MTTKKLYKLTSIIVLTLVIFYIAFYFGKKEQKKNVNVTLPAEFTVSAIVRNSISVEDTPAIAHYNLFIKDLDQDINLQALLKQHKSSPLFITVQTFDHPVYKKGYSVVLKSIVENDYQHVFSQLAEQLKNRKATTYLSLNPHPELPIQINPWHLQSPMVYINSFKKFVSTIKPIAPKVKMVFSTSGYPGCMEYFPGKDVVDFTSLVAYPSFEEKLSAYPVIDSTEYMLLRKMHRLRFAEKPILVLNGDKQKPEIVDWPFILKEQRELNNNLAAKLPKPQAKINNGFQLGVYDPKEKLVNKSPVNTEHFFINWRYLDESNVERKMAEAAQRGHQIILTVEPFKNPGAYHDREVLNRMLLGVYDKAIDSVYQLVSRVNTTVYLRFAHEMEIPIKRYPWQSQNPLTYIKAYRYFMNFENNFPKNALRVWGPAGDRGSMEWYPGDDAVDFISIAIYGLPAKGIEDHNQQERFPKIFDRKTWRMRFSDAPIFITEFGVKGPEDFQEKWLKEAGEKITLEREVYGACYFNLYDNPKVWGEGDAPDWSISAKSFETLAKALNLSVE